jgi:hypothetical protein
MRYRLRTLLILLAIGPPMLSVLTLAGAVAAEDKANPTGTGHGGSLIKAPYTRSH